MQSGPGVPTDFHTLWQTQPGTEILCPDYSCFPCEHMPKPMSQTKLSCIWSSAKNERTWSLGYPPLSQTRLPCSHMHTHTHSTHTFGFIQSLQHKHPNQSEKHMLAWLLLLIIWTFPFPIWLRARFVVMCAHAHKYQPLPPTLVLVGWKCNASKQWLHPSLGWPFAWAVLERFPFSKPWHFQSPLPPCRYGWMKKHRRWGIKTSWPIHDKNTACELKKKQQGTLLHPKR